MPRSDETRIDYVGLNELDELDEYGLCLEYC